MTILLTPFMSCTAKLPIYAFFVNAFFPGKGGFIMTSLYLLGVLMAVLIAYLYKGTLFKGEAAPFVMELPNYRLPSPKNVVRLLWEKAKDFLQRAFTVILIATVVVWFLQSFDFRLNPVADSHICTSFITGFLAKESVVSTLGILFAGDVAGALTPLSAGCLLVFCLLYTPCVASVAAIRRELGGKWAAAVVLWQCVLAWLMAFLLRLIGLLLG